MSAPASLGTGSRGAADETEAELSALAAAFESCSLSKAEWSHRAHLLVGMWYAGRLPADAALDAMRTGLRRLNASHGAPTTPAGGYHETITRAYMRLISRFVREDVKEDGWAARSERLLARHGERDHLLHYYSRERLMSPEARRGWVEPDLRPLP
jgi:hypothetical protein